MSCAPAGVGKRYLPSSGNVSLFCALLVTAKRSIDELFIHYFHRLSSVSGSFAPRRPSGLHSWTTLRDFRPQTPNLPTLGKISCGRPRCMSTTVRAKPRYRFNLVWDDYVLWSVIELIRFWWHLILTFDLARCFRRFIGRYFDPSPSLWEIYRFLTQQTLWGLGYNPTVGAGRNPRQMKEAHGGERAPYGS